MDRGCEEGPEGVDIDKELDVERKGWKCAIHMPEP
jgi:hypothetical protein